MSSDDDDDDCEYFLQPVSNQYNISEKIKEANQKLFSSKTETISQARRQSNPRVRFKDKLVEYESEEHEEMTLENGLRIESVEEEFEEDDEESIEVDNVEERIEEVSSEVEELRVNESVEIYDEKDFENEPLNIEGNEKSEENSVDFERPPARRRSSLPIVKRVTPSSESCEELRKLRATKNCCNFKQSNEYIEKLPKYNGFNSRYGLSKDDIERRELCRTRRQQIRNFKLVEQMQQQEMVARVNEEAFAKWLYKKLRHPVNGANKSNPVNMFDVKSSISTTTTTTTPTARRKFIQRKT